MLYTKAALSPDTKSRLERRDGRTAEPDGRRPSGRRGRHRRPLLKQQSEMSTGSSSLNDAFWHSNPEIVISGENEDDDGPRTPLPVLPVVPPELDSDENEADNEDNDLQFPDFLLVAQRYRKSSLVRMDAVKLAPPGAANSSGAAKCRRISVHGSLDLPRKDLSEFRNVVSFSAAEQKEENDTITISDIRPSKFSHHLLGRYKRTRRKKRSSLKRLRLLSGSDTKLNREELEERHAQRKREREERRAERRERKLKEKEQKEEGKFDEDGVSVRRKHIITMCACVQTFESRCFRLSWCLFSTFSQQLRTHQSLFVHHGQAIYSATDVFWHLFVHESSVEKGS